MKQRIKHEPSDYTKEAQRLKWELEQAEPGLPSQAAGGKYSCLGPDHMVDIYARHQNGTSILTTEEEQMLLEELQARPPAGAAAYELIRLILESKRRKSIALPF